MKIKNLYKIVCMLALIAVLAACGKGETLTKTFEKTQEGLVSTLTYKYQGDTVTEQSTKNIMQYTFLGVTTKEEAEKQIAPFTESYKGVEGITYNIDFGQMEAIETLTVDYNKADIADLKKIPGMSFDTEDDVKKISMKRSEELLKGQGYTEKK